MNKIKLSEAHIKQVQKDRRIVVNLDTGWGLPDLEKLDAYEYIDECLSYLAGNKDSQVASIFWNWGEMNFAPYKSKILEVNEEYQKWLKQGVDPLKICIDKSKEKGIEAFYSFRLNGANDFGDWALSTKIKENPHYGIPSPMWPAPFQHFNFAEPGVRQYKLDVIREVAENYDFDGIEIDFRCAYITFPLLRNWEYRNCMTEFMQSVREMLQEIAEKRGRPFLLAARVPENIEGCHYDGYDIERWVDEKLVDILALGCHNFEVDIEAFKRLTKNANIKLYPSLDDHHCANGYEEAPPALWRGVCSNFLEQGADGIYAFNFYPVPFILDGRFSPEREAIRQGAYCEMGSLETMKSKDKLFVVQRRGGGGWGETSEYQYANTNAFAQLPKEISTKAVYGDKVSGENYIALNIKEDVCKQKDSIKSIQLKLLLSDHTAKDLKWDQRIHDKPVAVSIYSINNYTQPPSLDILDNLRTRINGLVLNTPIIKDGWLIYDVNPLQLAPGKNIVGLRLLNRDSSTCENVTVEKLEIYIAYAK